MSVDLRTPYSKENNIYATGIVPYENSYLSNLYHKLEHQLQHTLCCCKYPKIQIILLAYK